MIADIIVIIILVILVGGASAYIVRAKRNGTKCIGCPAGGSCPGSGKLPKKKLSGPAEAHYTIRIGGMHCQNCAIGVTRAINQVDGAAARVNLKKQSAEVYCGREVNREDLTQAVEKAGYTVEEIKRKK